MVKVQEHRALIDPLAIQTMRMDDPQGRHGSSALHAPSPRTACRKIRSRFKPTLMDTMVMIGSHYKPCKALQMRRARHQSGKRAHLVSHVSRAHRVNPAFSVLREPTLLPVPTTQHLPRVQPLSPTTALRSSMAIIQPMWAPRIQHPPCQASAKNATNAAHVAIVAVVADATHVRARMIATAHANRARPTTPTPLSLQAKPTATLRSPLSTVNIQPPRHVSPTGCLTIPAMARLRLAPIRAHLAIQAVQWIARRDATAIIAKSAPRARRPFASGKARVIE